MKILHTIQRFPPAVGGGEEVVYQLCKALAGRGHNVTVVTSNWLHDVDIPGISSSRTTFSLPRYNLLPKESRDGFYIRRFKPWFRLWSFTLNPSMLLFLVRHANEFDIIHTHYYMFSESFYSVLAASIAHKPCVLTNHRSFTAHTMLGNAYRMANCVYNKTIGKLILKYINKLIVLNEEMKLEFEEMGVSREKLSVIPNGIDLERFRPLEVSKKIVKELGYPERIVLFVGRLEKIKGPQYIAEAAPLILSKFPRTKFVFVGEDWGYARSLKELGERLNINDKLILVGKIEEERLIEYYNVADVLVFPSLGEGFGMVALESIACGTPVVIADIDGLKHILDQIGGYKINMEKEIPFQIAETVIGIFLNPDIEKEIFEQRQSLDCKFNWRYITNMVEIIYGEVINDAKEQNKK